MPTPPLAQEVLQQAVDAFYRNGKNVTFAAQELGIPRNTLDARLKTARAKAIQPSIDSKIPAGHVLKGVSTLYDHEGNERLTWVKTDLEIEQQKKALLATVEALKAGIIREKPRRPSKRYNSDLLSCYVITDYHIGQFSLASETGEAWNIRLAEQMLAAWFEAAIQSAPEAETAILAQLGDFLHTDNIVAMTPTSGHILDADTRYVEMVAVVIRVLRQVITKLLRKHKTIHVLLAEGNHDISSSIWLRALFAEKYADEPRVIVNNHSNPYYAYEWGDTSLFFHHGHKRAIKEVSKVFAAQYREIFGRTRYSYAHMGHLHHVDVKEDNMMIVEQHPTLAAKDAHSSRSGYHSQRGATVITYHKKFGEVSRITIRPEMIGEE